MIDRWPIDFSDLLQGIGRSGASGTLLDIIVTWMLDSRGKVSYSRSTIAYQVNASDLGLQRNKLEHLSLARGPFRSKYRRYRQQEAILEYEI